MRTRTKTKMKSCDERKIDGASQKTQAMFGNIIEMEFEM